MDDRRTQSDLDAERDERDEGEGTIFPPAVAMTGGVAPVAGLAAVLAPGLTDADTDDGSEEARGARLEADPPTDPSAPQR